MTTMAPLYFPLDKSKFEREFTAEEINNLILGYSTGYIKSIKYKANPGSSKLSISLVNANGNIKTLSENLTEHFDLRGDYGLIKFSTEDDNSVFSVFISLD